MQETRPDPDWAAITGGERRKSIINISKRMGVNDHKGNRNSRLRCLTFILRSVLVTAFLFTFVGSLTSYASDNTELIKAAARGDIQNVKSLLANGADVNAEKKGGATALIMASQNGHGEIVKALLDKGADVNAKAYKGSTALYMASQDGYNDIVKALIAKGADVNAKAYKGLTALYVASENGHIDAVKALLVMALPAFAGTGLARHPEKIELPFFVEK